jgi:hypothetical protein
MSYRRNKDNTKRWREWLRNNRERLVELEVPLAVYETQDNWWTFIEHGCFPDDGTPAIIDVDKTNEDQALKLCVFLEAEEKDSPTPSCALNRLQYLLGRGLHAW